LSVLTAIERGLRGWSIKPKIQDDQRLWASVRDGMRSDNPQQIALVGTSRMQLDFDLHEFSRDMGNAPVAQLAIVGSAGLPVFEDLSHDVHFRGLVVFELVPWTLFGHGPPSDSTAIEYVNFQSHQTRIAPVEARLRTEVQRVFAFDKLRFQDLLEGLVDRRTPSSLGYTLDPDRGYHVDFSKVSQAQLRLPLANLMNLGTSGSPEELKENLRAFEADVRRIQARGGRVALVVLPSDGAVGAAERAACPRERYWDVLAAETSAVTLNWLDDPRLRKFKCPDGSHLDMRDQVEFTRIFVEDLRTKLAAQHPSPATSPAQR
jgi:hypothetical protein